MNVMTKRPEMVLGATKGFRYKGFFDERQAKMAKNGGAGSPVLGAQAITDQELLIAIQKYQLDPAKLRQPLQGIHIRSISDRVADPAPNRPRLSGVKRPLQMLQVVGNNTLHRLMAPVPPPAPNNKNSPRAFTIPCEMEQSFDGSEHKMQPSSIYDSAAQDKFLKSHFPQEIT